MSVAFFWHRRDHDFNCFFPEKVFIKTIAFFSFFPFWIHIFYFDKFLAPSNQMALVCHESCERWLQTIEPTSRALVCPALYCGIPKVLEGSSPAKIRACAQPIPPLNTGAFHTRKKRKRDFSSARPLFRRSMFPSLSRLLSSYSSKMQWEKRWSCLQARQYLVY